MKEIKEITDVCVHGMVKKLENTKHNANYFLHMESETSNERFLKRAERMYQCMDLLLWDKYETNKLLDLKKVNRCKDRFCPNCRSVSNAIALAKFKKPFEDLLSKGYKPFLLTLTVPNVPGEQLKDTIDKMQSSARVFMKKLNLRNKNSLKSRIFTVEAGIRSLEITVEKKRSNYYHPHFHILVFLTEYELTHFEKVISDGYDSNRKPRFISSADIFISKLWTMIYDGVSLKHFSNIPDRIIYSDGVRNYYSCDIRELELPGGLYEVFKYAFKDSDIKTYEHFKTIFKAIDGRRLKQGYGELYNMNYDCDDDELELDKADDIRQYLAHEESPSKLFSTTLEELTTVYKAYRKISRFKGSEHIELIN